MLCRIRAVADYVNASKAAIPHSSTLLTSLQEGQLNHLTSLIKSCTLDVAEAAAVLNVLAADSSDPAVAAAFTVEQRAVLAEAVVATKTTVGESASGTGVVAKQRAQTHYYFYNYLTEDDWKTVFVGNPMNSVKVLATRAHTIGLVYPSELTVVAIIAMRRK